MSGSANIKEEFKVQHAPRRACMGLANEMLDFTLECCATFPGKRLHLFTPDRASTEQTNDYTQAQLNEPVSLLGLPPEHR